MNRNLVAFLIGIMSLGLFIAAAILITPQANYAELKISDEEYQTITKTHNRTDEQLAKNIHFNGEKLYYASKDNTWYYSIIEEHTDAYNPYIKFEGSKQLKVAFKNSQTIDAATIEAGTPIDFVFYDDNNYHEYKLAITTLPIITINHDDEIVKDSDTELSFELFDNRKSTLKRITKTGGKIHVRGASTSETPKKSYRLNLRYKSPGEHDRNANEPLLGMREDDDWILYSAYTDHEKLRNSLCENLWYETSKYNLNVAHTTGVTAKWVEVIDNDQYAGLYALSTTIDEKTLGIKKTENGDYNNYIVKKIQWDDLIIEPNSDPIDYPYELKTDKIDDKAAANRKIRDYLYNTFGRKDVDYIKEHTDIQSLIDISLFANLTMNIDTVSNAPGWNFKNIYISNMETQAGEKYVYIPWDFDATWGNYWKENPYYLSPSIIIQDDEFVSATLRNNDESYRQKETYRYAKLRGWVWSTDHIIELVDEQEKDIFKSGAYARDIAAWPDSAKIDDPANWNLDRLRAYIRKRLEYTDYYYGLTDTMPEPLTDYDYVLDF